MYLIKTIKGDITNITDEEKTRNYAGYKEMHQKRNLYKQIP